MLYLINNSIGIAEIVAFILALIALILMFLTKRLTARVCKSEEKEQTVYLIIKVIAAAIALLAVAALYIL